MAEILLAVNADFAVRNSIGARTWHIAEALVPTDRPTVLCRGYSHAQRYCYPVKVVGLGRTFTRLLTGVRVYLSARFPDSRIRNALFSRSVLRYLKRRLRGGWTVDLVHSWVGFPRVLKMLRHANPGLVAIYDVSITPDCGVVLAELNAFDYFTVPSNYVADTLAECGIERQRIFLIPFGVDVDRFKPAERSTDSPLRVAFTGQLTRRKGVPQLLAAWKNLAPANAELHLYGRVYPEVANDIQAAADNVHVHGFVDLEHELPQNHLYVLPSYREGSAKSIYEALASGLPVITTAEAGSVIRDGVEGYIIPAGEVAVLSDRLRTLLTDNALRARMGIAARRRAEEYTWERYAQAVAQLHRALLK